MADKIKTLRVELEAGSSGFQKVFKEASASVGGLGKELGGMQRALSVGFGALAGLAAPLAGAFAAVGGAVVLATKQTIDYASALVDLATRSQHSVEWLQATKFAAEQSGTSLEAVTGASEKLRKALGEGSEKTAQAVRALGLSFQELRAASPDEQMNAVLKAIAGVGDATARTTITLQLFGRSGGELLPMADSFEELRKQAEDLGLVMAEKDVRAAEALGDSIGGLQSAFGGLVNNLGVTITSSAGVHEAVKILTAGLGDLSKWIAANRTEIRAFAVDGLGYLAGYISGVLSSIQLLVQAFFAMEKVGVDVTATFVRIATTARALQDVMSRPWAAGEIFSGLKTELGRITESQKAAIDSIEQKQSKMGAAFSSGQAVIVKTTAALQSLGAAEVKVGEGATGAAGGLIDLSDASKEAAKDAAALAKTLLDADKAFHAEAMKTWDEWGKNADENIKGVTSEYLRISGLLGPTSGEVASAFDDLQKSLWQRGGLENLNTAELTKYISEMERLGDTGKLTEAQWGKLGDAYTLAMKKGILGADNTKTAFQSLKESFAAAVADLPGVILGAIQGGGDVGKAIGAHLGGSIGTSLGASLGPKLKDIFGKTLGGALGSLAGPLGSLLGGLVGDLGGKLFSKLGIGGNKTIMEVNKLRDAFFQAQGGFVELQKKLSGLSNQDLVKKIFNAKTVEQFNAAVSEVMGLLGSQEEAQQALKEATDRYGFSLQELGPAMQRQELDQQAAQLLQDFRLLTASGIDVGTVIGKMGPSFAEFVNQSRAAGQAIPEAMRPMVDALIQSGQLLDENGNAFKSAEDAGITFAETLTEGLTRAVDAIDRLVSALTGVPPVKIPVSYEVQGGPPSGLQVPSMDLGDLPSFASGGIGDFGRGALAVLHGREAIIPLDGGGGAGGALGGPTINVYPTFEENPLQTYEARQQLREHTVRTLYQEASRSLAAAVAAGGA